jgi:hypothetical protein
MKSVGKWFNNLNSETQFKVVITGLIIAFLIYYFAVRPRLKQFGEAASPRAELAYLAVRGIKPTHPDNIYSQMADMAYNAMRGIGTKFHTIKAVYAVMRNDADIIKFDLAFGKRPGRNMLGILQMYTLEEWVNDDLSAAQILEINNMLRNRGITKLL